MPRQLLRHENRFAVVHAEDRVELAQVHDWRNELVRDALNAMVPDFLSVDSVGDAGRPVTALRAE